MPITRKLAVLLLLLLFFGALAFAQGGATGAIGGVVQDASGAVIANAKVSVWGRGSAPSKPSAARQRPVVTATLDSL
ncbi:MAG: hypothetical protein ABR920_17520 [Terriglobales bacterium]